MADKKLGPTIVGDPCDACVRKGFSQKPDRRNRSEHIAKGAEPNHEHREIATSVEDLLLQTERQCAHRLSIGRKGSTKAVPLPRSPVELCREPSGMASVSRGYPGGVLTLFKTAVYTNGASE